MPDMCEVRTFICVLLSAWLPRAMVITSPADAGGGTALQQTAPSFHDMSLSSALMLNNALNNGLMVNANYLHDFSFSWSISTSSLKHSLKSFERFEHLNKLFLGLNNSLFLETLKKCLRSKTLRIWSIFWITGHWTVDTLGNVTCCEHIILAALISFIGYWIVCCRAVPLPRPGWGPPAGHGWAMGLQGTSPGLALRSATSPSPLLYWAQPRPDTGHCSDIIIRLTKIA